MSVAALRTPMNPLRLPLLAVAAALAGLAGCAAPPPLPPQAAPVPPAAFSAPALPDAPRLAADWWRVFDDPVLAALVARAEDGNAGLQAAAARVAQARALADGSRAPARPRADLGAGASRQGGPLVNAAGTEGNLFTASVQFGWEVDLSGRLARAADAATLDAASRESLLAAARLAVQAEVAQTYFLLRALDAERVLAEDSLRGQRDGLQIAEQRVQSGSLPAADLARWQADVASAEADLQVVERRRAEAVHALALLVGEAAPGFALAAAAWAPRAPAVPAGIPSEVLARRADIVAAAQALAAAEARAGEARSAWWPRLLLTAGGGQASPALGTLLQSAARAWGLGLVASLPLFDGGRRDAEAQRADADVLAARAAHRQQVLVALKEVEDQLAALRTLGDELALRQRAVDAAARASALSASRHAQGLASRIDLLKAQRHEGELRRAALQVRSQQVQATVALIRALGGGWAPAQS